MCQIGSWSILLYTNIYVCAGYETTKGVENYDGVNESDGELTLSMSILKNQIGFSPSSSSLGTLSQNSKIGSDGQKFFYDYNAQVYNMFNFFISGLNAFWISIFTTSQFFFTTSQFCYTQNVEVGNQVNTLSHHMSFPRKSSKMFVVENLHQFPDSSVPSSIRAKRGCATHPRSVAERVRRTRISDRMKKLQELVPNIDKVRFIITEYCWFFLGQLCLES